MIRWFGPALLALTLMFGGTPGINPAAAAQPQSAVQKSQAGMATDFSARRYYRHIRGPRFVRDAVSRLDEQPAVLQAVPCRLGSYGAAF